MDYRPRSRVKVGGKMSRKGANAAGLMLAFGGMTFLILAGAALVMVAAG